MARRGVPRAGHLWTLFLILSLGTILSVTLARPEAVEDRNEPRRRPVLTVTLRLGPDPKWGRVMDDGRDATVAARDPETKAAANPRRDPGYLPA